MDILEAVKSVCGQSDVEVANAVDKLDKELAEIQLNIVQYCADGDFECAWEDLALYDRTMKLKEFVCSLRNAENVMEV